MIKEIIAVNFPGKFGPNVAGTFYGIDQKSGLKPEQFEKGKTYTVLINTAKSGKKYIAQIVGEGEQEVTEKPGDDKVIEDLKKDAENSTKTAKELGYKGRDFDAEARGKIACALRAALYSSPMVPMYSTSWEDALKKIDAEVIRGSEEVLKAQRSK